MERLHKALAASGVASRRACEQLIAAGRVTVNGRVVTTPGTTVSDGDALAVDGKPVARHSARSYVMLHKPAGYVTTAGDPQGRPTVLDLLRAAPASTVGSRGETRLYPVGRLDADSEGLLLLTDDGELTFRLTHPSFALEKEYRVLVAGTPGPAALAALRNGVELDGKPTAPAAVSVEAPARQVEPPARQVAARRRGPRGRAPARPPAPQTHEAETWLRFVIHEGRNRQIRRMCLTVGHPVRRLIRVRVGSIRLGSLAPGKWRPLTAAEIQKLKELTRQAPETKDARPPRHRVNPSTITIDGPAAAGKSALGERLADRLHYLYFDTGVLYRAVAWLALQRGIDAADEQALSRLASEAKIEVTKPTVTDGRQYTVSVDGEDVTWKLRGIDVERIVSPVAAIAGVRQALRQRQREIGLAGHVVMVGRDIGTVVLPEADLKIYLTASPEERARRRHREILARGDRADYGQLLASILERDRIDSQRAVAPLKPADDAVVIDTDRLSIDQEMALVEQLLC